MNSDFYIFKVNTYLEIAAVFVAAALPDLLFFLFLKKQVDRAVAYNLLLCIFCNYHIT